MRRSFAPSAFKSPLVKRVCLDGGESGTQVAVASPVAQPTHDTHEPERKQQEEGSDFPALLASPTPAPPAVQQPVAVGGERHVPTPSVPKFKSPVAVGRPVVPGVAGSSSSAAQQQPAATTASLTATGLATAGEAEPPTRYFSAMWCKLSNKKHKSWESDAVLIVKGRKVTLKDSEGKDIGQSSSYGPKELASLKSGETLVVGSREVEINQPIAPEDFMSGRCFTAVGIGAATTKHVPGSKTAATSMTSTGLALAANMAAPRVSTSFRKVVTSATVLPNGPAPPPPARHDPTAENALVMQRPSREHYKLHGKGVPHVVDVVVDPFLSVQLRPHQRDGVRFLYECVTGMRTDAGFGAILADEMGLGKTLQCVTLLWTLLKQGPYMGTALVKRALVVCPSSLVKNWQREFKKWLGDHRLQTFAVSAENRPDAFLLQTVIPVMIVSYEMLRQEIDVISKVPFDIVFCDEGHRLKNESAKISQALMSLSTRRRIILTGTPIQNDLQEFFSLLEFCNPGIVGTATTFKRIYENPIVASRQPEATQDEKLLGQQRASQLQQLTSLFCLRRTSDVNRQYLPPKIEYVVFCEPSPLQLAIYRKVLQSAPLRSCFDSSSRASQHLVAITSLKKICNSPALIHELAKNAEKDSLFANTIDLFPDDFSPDTFDAAHSGKMAALAQILCTIKRDTTDRVVIVSNYTQTLDHLEKLCAAYEFSFARLDGSTPTAKRQPIVEAFNSKYSTDYVFLLSSKAGGVGLNLVGACRLILVDTDWNPANDLQAMARVWRDGQTRTVHLYRMLLTGSIDEKIYQRQLSKQGLSVAVSSNEGEASAVSFSQDELRDLFSLREDTLCDTHDLMSCSCETGRAAREVNDSENVGGNALKKTGLGRGGAAAALKQRLIDTGKLKASVSSELQSWAHVDRLHFEQLPSDAGLNDVTLDGKLSFVFHRVFSFGSAPAPSSEPTPMTVDGTDVAGAAADESFAIAELTAEDFED
ncbi:Rad54b protein [Capsaspora owczarzaki ATCC 30864]|uniref:Rad54b protein n=1 Tax=Capsaspora owczarzaki (strain ATCC 30864) TaxID=595528 RepID=UPI000352303C|nr:Rad54b protein [Capsaspora owczarzaki ATCC 30864]|eukprot:XP_004363429.2 Rad54b protein [Capsaspora owczarzaki ATCC 30864]